MSLRPGIAKNWYEEYKNDVYPSDEIIIENRHYKPPRYYDGLYELDNPIGHQQMKNRRIEYAMKHDLNNTPERLKVRETVQKSKIKQLKRPLHDT